MGERIKKVFSSRIFISVSGAIIAYFIVGVINSFTGKINLWESLLNLPVKIYLIKIPDFIILIFVLIIVIWLILINKKFQGLSPKKFVEMRASNERMQRHNESLIKSANNIIAVNEGLGAENEKLKAKIEKIRIENKAEIEKIKEELLKMLKKSEDEKNKDEVLELYEEMGFILDVLANQPNRTLEQRELWHYFGKKYPKEKPSGFQIILNDLDKQNLIEETTCGDFGEICWRITRKGLDCLKEIVTI